MAKRLTVIEKKEMVNLFINGQSIDELSKKFECVKSTIIRNLKNTLDSKEYNFFINKNKTKTHYENNSQQEDFIKTKKDLTDKEKISNDSIKVIDQNEEPIFFPNKQFMEITPLDCQISNEMQRDLSSVAISEVELPKIVYIIVDHKIELETKILKDYPEWQFLSSSELKRKTIQIYFDLKIAKRFCNKEQKVIKVPNTDVFKIAAKILLSRGITRIVSPEHLISL